MVFFHLVFLVPLFGYFHRVEYRYRLSFKTYCPKIFVSLSDRNLIIVLPNEIFSLNFSKHFNKNSSH